MRNSLWWSYRHLEAKAGQRLANAFRIVGVFRGPFTTRAFAQISSDSDPTLLLDLQAYSLVQRLGADSWRCHRETQVFAQERLADTTENSSIEDLFAGYYIEVIGSVGWKVGEAPEALNLMRVAAPNWQAALQMLARRSTEEEDDEAAKRLSDGLVWLQPFVSLERQDPSGVIAQCRDTCQHPWQNQCLIACNELLGDVALFQYDLQRSAKYFIEAKEIADKVDNVQSSAHCLMRIADIEMRAGNWAHAKAHFELCRTFFRDQENKINEANCEAGLGDIAFHEGDLDTAQAHYQTSLELSESVPYGRLGVAMSTEKLANIALERRDYERAINLLNSSLQICTEFEDHLGQARCLRLRARVLKRLNRSEEAESALRDVIRRIDDFPVHDQAEASLDIARHFLERRAFDDTESWRRRALSGFAETSDEVGEAECIALLGAMELEQGHPDQAIPHFEESAAVFRRFEAYHLGAQTIKGLGYARILTGDMDGGARDLELADRIFKSIGDVHGRAQCMERFAGIISDIPKSIEAFSLAFRLYKESQDTLGEANCLRAIGDRSQGSERLDRWQEALDIYLQLEHWHSVGVTHFRFATELSGGLAQDHCAKSRHFLELAERQGLIEGVVDSPNSPCSEC
jgi:tetratricopeptide (TPR) repeat protein